MILPDVCERFVLVACVLAGCSATVGPGSDGAVDGYVGGELGVLDVANDRSNSGVDSGPITDVPSATDVLPFASCNTAADCASLGNPGSVAFCNGASAWSCLDHRCTWACGTAHTCVSNATCVQCDDHTRPACPGDACSAGFDPATGVMRDSTCQRLFAFTVGSCFGNFVRLTDGTLCSLEPTPTNSIHAVLACQECQVVFDQR